MGCVHIGLHINDTYIYICINSCKPNTLNFDEVYSNPFFVQVKLSVLWSYIQACGWSSLVVLVFAILVYLSADIFSNVWLSEWSDDANKENPVSVNYRLGIYGAIGAGLGQYIHRSRY